MVARSQGMQSLPRPKAEGLSPPGYRHPIISVSESVNALTGVDGSAYVQRFLTKSVINIPPRLITQMINMRVMHWNKVKGTS